MKLFDSIFKIRNERPDNCSCFSFQTFETEIPNSRIRLGKPGREVCIWRHCDLPSSDFLCRSLRKPPVVIPLLAAVFYSWGSFGIYVVSYVPLGSSLSVVCLLPPVLLASLCSLLTFLACTQAKQLLSSPELQKLASFLPLPSGPCPLSGHQPLATPISFNCSSILSSKLVNILYI